MSKIIKVNEGALKSLNELGINYELQSMPVRTNPMFELDTSNWIMIPEDFEERGFITYIDPSRLIYNNNLKQIERDLNLNLGNSAKDSLDRPFMGKINWENALIIGKIFGKHILSLNELMEYLHLLDEGAKGERKVFLKSGKRVPTNYLKLIKEDLIKSKSPWRGEWIDGYFQKEKEFNLNSLHNQYLNPSYSNPLIENTLIKDKRISLESLFHTKTNQGFPTKKTEPGDFYYVAPIKNNNSAIILSAYASRVCLNCNWYPSDLNYGIGLRLAE